MGRSSGTITNDSGYFKIPVAGGDKAFAHFSYTGYRSGATEFLSE